MISEDREGKKMARYICSDCYKEFESEQKPEYCPGCGADAGKLQLLTQSQINDEMETTMGNLRLLLNLLDAYVEKVRGINADYKKRLDAMQASQSSQIKNCDDKHAQELSKIEYERTSVLETVEKQYKGTLSAEQKKADSYKRQQNETTENSRKYRDEMQKRVDNGRKHIDHIMEEVRKAEAHIIPKKYHKMAKQPSPPTVEVAATTMDGIMAMHPQVMADQLNVLNEKFIRRIIKASEINRKFIEFYSMKMKAEQLYQKEMAELNAMLPDSDSKAQKMIAEARQRFSMQMSQHEKDTAKNKQDYIAYCAETNQKYDRQRSEAMTRHAQQKKTLLAQHEQQTKDLDASKKRDLLASDRSFQSVASSYCRCSKTAESKSKGIKE